MNTNKHHIERIIKSYRDNPDRWIYVWRSPEIDFSYRNIYVAYNNMGKHEELLSSMGDELADEIMVMCIVASGAILCLLAYPDCGYMLDSDPDELNLLCKLGDERAKLMYAACHLLKETDEQQQASY